MNFIMVFDTADTVLVLLGFKAAQTCVIYKVCVINRACIIIYSVDNSHLQCNTLITQRTNNVETLSDKCSCFSVYVCVFAM